MTNLLRFLGNRNQLLPVDFYTNTVDRVSSSKLDQDNLLVVHSARPQAALQLSPIAAVVAQMADANSNWTAVGLEAAVNGGGGISEGSASDVTTGSGGSVGGGGGEYAPWQVALISHVCGVIIVGTLLGNVLVCAAVGVTRKLRTPSNLLIVSLAVADLLVAALDMPFATAYEVMGKWVLGEVMCDVWTSLDVLLCTASILNLCAISVDRYLVITQPFKYAMKRTPVRMLLMIAAVWSLSALISIPPLFGWRVSHKPDQCSVSQDIGYQFYATIGAFYIPLLVMIVIYTRIYLVSARIARAEAKATVCIGHCTPPPPRAMLPPPLAQGDGGDVDLQLIPAESSGDVGEAERQMSLTTTVRLGSMTTLRRESATLHDRLDLGLPVNGQMQKRSRGHSLGELIPRKIRSSCSGTKSGNAVTSSSPATNERKATKTLGVIMGAFVVCWLPFFIIALVRPFCSDQQACIPSSLASVFLWLGYANSFLNPIIYARFNRDFRTPFKYLLQCKCKNINSRMRSEEFTVQFGPMIDRRESTAANSAVRL